MKLDLPRPVQQKLEQALAQWPQWQCDPALKRPPRLVAELSAGHSNFSVLVEGPERLVVRIDGVAPATLGLHRHSEWRTLHTASSRGIAPAPRYFNPDLGCLVCDYLPHDQVQERPLSEVARLLRDIHELPPRHHRLDIGERILRYEKLLAHKGRSISAQLKNCQSSVKALLYDLGQQAGPPVLCHNDLLQSNRIYSGGTLWAIDWEYCAMGSPWYDIAVVANGDSLSDIETDQLLQAYLGRTARSRERAVLQQYGTVYRYLELLWYLALDRPVLTLIEIDSKTQALTDRLARSPH